MELMYIVSLSVALYYMCNAGGQTIMEEHIATGKINEYMKIQHQMLDQQKEKGIRDYLP